MKTYLIPGATGGIGSQVARRLVADGHSVILTGRNEEKLAALQAEFGDRCRTIALDLCAPESLEGALKPLLAEVGALDGMVYCAGTPATRPLKLSKPDFVQEVMAINFGSFVELVRILSKKGNLNAGASIVGISSVSASRGNAAKVLYGASKAAMDAAVRAIATDLWDKGVRINTVLAGLVKTAVLEQYQNTVGGEGGFADLLKKQYTGPLEPSDVADAIAFLLSDSAAKITGSTLSLDGGILTS